MRGVRFAAAMAVAVGIGLGGASPARAMLIDLGLVTRDPGAGLDWLDLTETVGLSFDDIQADPARWADQGWRHASTAETCDFFGKLGLVPAPCPGDTGSVAGNAVATHQALLGITNDFAPEVSLGSVGIFDDGDPALLGLAEAVYDVPGDSSRAAVRTHFFPPGLRSPNQGHFLVRPVPEPAPGVLVALGSTAFAWRRRARGPAPGETRRVRRSSRP